MICWNCGKQVPEGAKSCQYCEKQLDPTDALGELTARIERGELSDEERQLLTDSLLGNLDDETRRELFEAMSTATTADDLVASIFVGDCPKCGSSETEDCSDIKGIESPCVGRCKQCATLFCTECCGVFKADKITDASNKCPKCGSTDTDYDAINEAVEKGNFEEDSDVCTCFDCNTTYCAYCGQRVELKDEDDEEV